MSDKHPIRVRRGDLPYGIVPKSLVEDSRLSATARLIAVWFCVQSINWELRVNHMRKVLSIGKDADLAARRQLEKYGYLRVRQKMKGNGVFGYLEYEFNPNPPGTAQPLEDRQAAAASVTVGGFSAVGSPDAGATDAGSTDAGAPTRLTSTKRTKQRKQEQPQQTKAAPAQPSPSGGDLIFPRELGEADRLACLQVMRAAGIDRDAQQGLLDELCGALRAGRVVANPAGWVRRLAGLHVTGDLVLEHAGEVAEARRARAAHLARTESAVAVPTALAAAKPPVDLDAWRKRTGIPPRRTGQSCGLGGTFT